MNNLCWLIKEKLYRLFRYRFPFHFIIQQENQNLVVLWRSIDATGKKVVDLGTGQGNTWDLIEKTNACFGVDATFAMLVRSRQLHPHASLIQADAICLPLQTESISVALAIGLSEYVQALELLFIEVHRILTNEGHFIVTFSPSGIVTVARSLMGNRIYARNLEQIKTIGETTGFQILRAEHSFMQWQVLLQKA